jgi:hypothetical protein
MWLIIPTSASTDNHIFSLNFALTFLDRPKRAPTSAIVATLNHNMTTWALGQYNGTTLHNTDDEGIVEISQSHEARAQELANDADSADNALLELMLNRESALQVSTTVEESHEEYDNCGLCSWNDC